MVSISTTQRQSVRPSENAAERWEPREGRVPPSLELCRACHCQIWPHETNCPYCGANIQIAAEARAEDVRRREAAMNAVKALLDKYREKDLTLAQ